MASASFPFPSLRSFSAVFTASRTGTQDRSAGELASLDSFSAKRTQGSSDGVCPNASASARQVRRRSFFVAALTLTQSFLKEPLRLAHRLGRPRQPFRLPSRVVIRQTLAEGFHLRFVGVIGVIVVERVEILAGLVPIVRVGGSRGRGAALIQLFFAKRPEGPDDYSYHYR